MSPSGFSLTERLVSTAYISFSNYNTAINQIILRQYRKAYAYSVETFLCDLSFVLLN
jgi:hypothetical protein